jgi:hypothetical protein
MDQNDVGCEKTYFINLLLLIIVAPSYNVFFLFAMTIFL